MITNLLKARDMVKKYRDAMANEQHQGLIGAIVALNELMENQERLIGEAIKSGKSEIKELFMYLDYGREKKEVSNVD